MVKTQSSRLMNRELDAVWQQFLRKRISSFIEWDLVRFFHDNPHTVDTASNIAQVVGRDVAAVRQALDSLVQADVLLSKTVSGQRIYRLTEDGEMRGILHDFVTACHNRDFREAAIQYVVHSMSTSAHQN